MDTNQKIKELYDRLYAEKYVSGISKEIGDLVIDIDEYIAGVVGLTSQYLHGGRPPEELIRVDNELAVRTSHVITEMNSLRRSLEMAFELAKMLQEELKNSQD